MSKAQYFLGALSFYGFVGLLRELNWLWAIVAQHFGYVIF